MPTSAFSLWISLLLFLGHKCFFAEVEPLQEQRGSPEIQSCFLGEMPAVVIPGTSRIPMSSCKLYSRDKTTLSFTKEAVFFFLEGKERVIFVGPMMKITIQMVTEAVIATAPPVISFWAGPCPQYFTSIIHYLQVTKQETVAEVDLSDLTHVAPGSTREAIV